MTPKYFNLMFTKLKKKKNPDMTIEQQWCYD